MSSTWDIDESLRVAGVSIEGSREEKTNRLIKHCEKQNKNSPKKTIAKKNVGGSSNISPKKLSPKSPNSSKPVNKVEFFKMHRPNVMKKFDSHKDIRDELHRMWSDHNARLVKKPNPVTMTVNNAPLILDFELDYTCCLRQGLKKIGEKDGKYIYQKIPQPIESDKVADKSDKVASKKPMESDKVASKKSMESDKVAGKKPIGKSVNKKHNGNNVTLSLLHDEEDDDDDEEESPKCF